MYSSNFAIAIKANGRVLREQADLVTLPFGTEFSVFVRNLNSTRAQFTVTVDGKDATEGCRLILPANGSVELERFIRNGNLGSGNRFRFVERTDAIEQHRGIGVEDGLVRVECWKERVIPPPVHVPVVHDHYDVWHPNRPPYYPSPHYSNITYGTGCHTSTVNNNAGFRSFDSNVNTAKSVLRSASCNFMQASGQSVGAQGLGGSGGSQTMDWGSNSAPANDAGITVPGSHSNQAFTSMSGFPLEAASVVLTLKLRGGIGGQAAVKPVTVDVRRTCGSCGKSSKGGAEFCSRCGTALHLL